MAVEKQESVLDYAEVESRTILRVQVGSTVHGIGVAGTDDRDELGVCLEPPEYVIGLRHFEQIVQRSQPQGVRSQPGDLDLTIYCHDLGAKILTADLEWVEAETIEAGTKLISFDAEPPTKARHRHFKTGTVTAVQTRVMERCLLATSQGEGVVETIVTPDHKFLIRDETSNSPRMQWREAGKLVPGDEIYALPIWDHDHSWEAGYLAGQFDGEGCLSFSKTPASTISWVQKPGPEVVLVERLLDDLGFSARKHTHDVSGCSCVTIGGSWTEQMRFLGSIRPRRLLRHPQFSRLWEERSLQGCTQAKVKSVLHLPPGNMRAIEVDAHTYVADGLLSHNSLRKFCSLALKGNPSVLLLFNVPAENCLEINALGYELRDLAWAFASKKSGAAFLGYMQQQKQRLMGERGQMNVKRPELVHKYGYDTKYAAQIIRLGYQGIDYMRFGLFPIPMPKEQRDYILAVRTGEVSENEVLTHAGELEQDLKDEVDATLLPDKPNYDAVNSFLIDAYQRGWKDQ